MPSHQAVLKALFPPLQPYEGNFHPFTEASVKLYASL